MLDLTRTDPALLHLLDDVVAELLAKSTLLGAAEVMVVGARCRDILQSALGHDFSLRTTTDIDLGLAVRNWAAYDELTDVLPGVGDTGIRFHVANTLADLVPFGSVENPPGTVTQPHAESPCTSGVSPRLLNPPSLSDCPTPAPSASRLLPVTPC